MNHCYFAAQKSVLWKEFILNTVVLVHLNCNREKGGSDDPEIRTIEGKL